MTEKVFCGYPIGDCAFHEDHRRDVRKEAVRLVHEMALEMASESNRINPDIYHVDEVTICFTLDPFKQVHVSLYEVGLRLTGELESGD